MGARPYDPNTGRFLSVDPVPGGSLNNYDYAGQDPINNYDLTGDWFGANVFHQIVNAVAEGVYAPYYLIHKYKLYFADPALLFVEAQSLGGDMALDWMKEKFGWEKSVCDEGPNQRISMLSKSRHHFLPGCRYVHGHVHIDYP